MGPRRGFFDRKQNSFDHCKYTPQKIVIPVIFYKNFGGENHLILFNVDLIKMKFNLNLTLVDPPKNCIIGMARPSSYSFGQWLRICQDNSTTTRKRGLKFKCHYNDVEVGPCKMVHRSTRNWRISSPSSSDLNNRSLTFHCKSKLQ